MSFPRQRPRRLRSTPALRRLVARRRWSPALVLPMFVADGIDEPRPIGSMPGVVQHTGTRCVAPRRTRSQPGSAA